MTFPDGRITLIEAIRLTLLHDPNLKLSEQQAIAAKGTAQTASGQFDPLLDANLSYSDTKTALTPSQVPQPPVPGYPNESDAKNSSLGLFLLFPFRDGATVGVVGNGSWTSNTLTGGDPAVVANSPDLYYASVGFTLDAALLRGRGSDATGSAERSARINWEASELSYRHAASTSVLATVTAYWNLVAAQEQLGIAKKTLVLSTKTVEVSRSLIAADEIPRAELSRVLASQATDMSQVASAERSLFEARVSLAIAIGLSVGDEANAPLAADLFPAPPEQTVLDALKAADLSGVALERRLDRKAAVKLKESGGVLLTGAMTGLRPKLDFHGQVTTGTVAESSLSGAGSGWKFPLYSASLAFEAPLGNNAARGLVLQREAALSQQTISLADLERQIRANVVQICRSLAEAADQVARAQEATELYAKTVADENEKFRNSQSTLIDTITTRQLGTSADVAYASARQQLSTLLAQLRFETGTLVDEADGRNVVRKETLLTLPRAEAAK
jgi:outer membrane protein TolC